MAKNNYFQFKQFRITQEKAAMKVGIDGVLLGAWARLERANRILDIGTGTGLLALMAAQRSNAVVDAVELDSDAFDDAVRNFESSNWKNRLHTHNCAFQDFTTEIKYDHIISNPPFFDNSPRSADAKRAKARHVDTLPLDELLEKVVLLLHDGGRISLIFPSGAESRVRILARQFALYITRLVPVFPDETKKSHRILVELSFYQGMIEETPIYIRDAALQEYSDQYREMTKEFYLDF